MQAEYKSKAEYLIIGLGATGLSVARYLAERGLRFSVADTRYNPPGLNEFTTSWPDASIWLGPLDAELTSRMSTLVVSPGISVNEQAISAARAAGVEVIGDVELFCREVSTPILAVTGSNAKSTVTTLIGEMAAAAGKQVGVGGNIGLPVLDLLREGRKDLYVLELSSFQLETTQSLTARGAVLLNISEDHLDRYVGMDEYILAKQRIFHRCETAIFNRADALTVPIHGQNARRLSFGLDHPTGESELGLAEHEGQTWLFRGDLPLMPTAEVPLAGDHGISNALAAFALGFAAGLSVDAMRRAVVDFQSLPHRCQRLASRKGVVYYNDSKATNVGATLAAVKGLKKPDSPLWLILGGEGKGQDFSPFKTALQEGIGGVALIGRDAVMLAEQLPESTQKQHCDSLARAVEWIASRAKAGDQVLLSPACASFDQFRGFVHRGEVFTECVLNLPD
ncbi:MAG: UDP-N-acetylmuramoyl-L-alanine--D-glutamate ligase [Marinospirillum sp.]|uniref:UDP-N-acetylmuramoyl-L-alanine--D-glutamate ligase n=1 Tax=Marinospirillum sp. TaxID=2183934 RepID=UPI0019EC829B|nr:UDP-N-acetylmuramoyl-L-alanine--D-glutamate ligase [Marinospirillum sp.]MBE0505367.1 UDP-N-acetylmuramoyl-L-alanine--D-glutamate ligase [Marinospirillum sp.]